MNNENIKSWNAYINNAGGVQIIMESNSGELRMLDTYGEEKACSQLLYFLKRGDVTLSWLDRVFNGITDDQEEINETWQSLSNCQQSELFANSCGIVWGSPSETAQQILSLADTIAQSTAFERLSLLISETTACSVLNDLIADKLDEEHPEYDTLEPHEKDALWHSYCERYSGDAANELITDDIIEEYL